MNAPTRQNTTHHGVSKKGRSQHQQLRNRTVLESRHKSNSAHDPQRTLPSKPTKDSYPIENLLNIEAMIRNVEKLAELKYLLANETKKLVGAKQVFIHEIGKSDKLSKIEIVSSIATVDPNAPMLISLNDEIKRQVSNTSDEKEKTIFRIKPESEASGNFPFSYVIHLPLKNRSGKMISAISYLKDIPFSERDVALANRIVETSAHAWAALQPRRFKISSLFTKPVTMAVLLLMLFLMFVPLPLTVLAPVEIVPHRPKLVAAPLSGVIDKINVLPNTHVKTGALLFSLNKIELLSKFEVTTRNAAVALAKFKNATQGAFGSSDSKRDLAITKAEYEVAIAERDFAQSQLELADVRAAKSGIILFSGVENWLGKPVETGERIMRVADPSRVRMRIEVDVADSIILENGANVSAFLDSNPLDPVTARLETQSYQAEKSERDTLVFPLTAKLDDADQIALRIGLRGTAQVYGAKVPLWFYLFRKPISAIRQIIGY